MKHNWLGFAGALSVAFSAAVAITGCGASHDDGISSDDDGVTLDDSASDDESMDLGSMEQHLQNCQTPDGTNAVMAAFAVAVGQELGRWQSTKDFEMFTTSGQSESSPGMQQAIRLRSGTGPDGKPRGKSRCSDGKCARTQALLDMQYEQARNKIYIQGESSTNKVLLDPGALRARMVAKVNYEQASCDQNARDNDANACPVETHKLVPAGTVNLGGCGLHYKFAVTKDATGTLLYPAQLKQKLTFADQANGWVDFRNMGGGFVAIDPTYGLNDVDTTSTGSCASACTKISLSDVSNQCCSCGGVNKKFVKASYSAVTYTCN
jgi:hypothetical protein